MPFWFSLGIIGCINLVANFTVDIMNALLHTVSFIFFLSTKGRNIWLCSKFVPSDSSMLACIYWFLFLVLLEYRKNFFRWILEDHSGNFMVNV